MDILSKKSLEVFATLLKVSGKEKGIIKVKDFPELEKFERDLRDKLKEDREELVFPLSSGGKLFSKEYGLTYRNIVVKEKYWLKELGNSGFAYMWNTRAFFFGLMPGSATRILKFVKALKKRGYL